LEHTKESCEPLGPSLVLFLSLFLSPTPILALKVLSLNFSTEKNIVPFPLLSDGTVRFNEPSLVNAFDFLMKGTG
jgi:hypothetical protein